MNDAAIQPDEENRPEGREDEDLRLLRNSAAALMEHFETVQIFATRHNGESGTTNAFYGSGNWYARFGQVSGWLAKQDHVNRNEE